MELKPPPPTAFPSDLLWLADAPLFIDSNQVEQFYDAVVRPESKEGTTTMQITAKTASELSGRILGGAKVGPSGLLTKLLTYFPFIKVELEGTAEAAGKTGGGKDESRTLQLYPISNPTRQLVQLAIHYMINQQDRLFWVNKPADAAWRDPGAILASPRALTFLDLPPGTKLIPTAAEFANGRIVQLYASLTKPNGEKPPQYPELEDFQTPQELPVARKAYWTWFDENFNATRAMLVVEEAASTNGRAQWIDYRLPLTPEGDTLHLHTCPAAKYDTGVFAYNFIKRGFKHGLRLVGTLKSEPDMNVLAVYEK